MRAGLALLAVQEEASCKGWQHCWLRHGLRASRKPRIVGAAEWAATIRTDCEPEQLVTRHAGGFLQSLSPEDREAIQVLASTGSAAIFIQDTTWNSMCRKVFRTSRGHFGIGPRIMKTGDVCAVVPGSVYPLVLRKRGDGYRVVGPALLYGFMNGEAVS